MNDLDRDDLQPAPLRFWLWTALSHYWRVVGWMLLFYSIVAAIELIESPIVILLPYALPQFASACLHMLLAAGPVLVCLAQLKGESWSFGTFFGGFQRKWAWSLICYLIGMTLIAGGVALLLFVPVAALFWLLNSFLWLVGSPIHKDFVFIYACLYAIFCSLVAAMFIWVRLRFFALPLMLERAMSVDEALWKSWELSRGRWGLLLKAAFVLASFHLAVFLPSLAFGMASQLAMPDFSQLGNRDYNLANRLGAVSGMLAVGGLAAQALIYPFTALATNAGYVQMTRGLRVTALDRGAIVAEPLLK